MPCHHLKNLWIPTILAGSIATISIITACSSMPSRPAAPDIAFTIDANGELVRPTGYRSWIYIGTPVTPNDMNNGKAAFPEFHNVYIDPVSYEHYAATGEFRDGTILVKELISVGSKSAVSGKGYFMGDFLGLEATVKSSKHYPDEPGNWAYFSYTQPKTGILTATAKPFPTKSCNACHAASADQDFVFTQYYPVLRAARGAGLTPEDGARRTMAMAKPMPKNDKWSGSAPTPASVAGAPPLGSKALFAWLKAGEYKKFPSAESKTHPGRGPHTERGLPVRVWINEALDDSLKAGSDNHPAGATAVKEMFTADGKLQGWAVMAKTQNATEDGKGWFWYEVTSASDENAIAAVGNGVAGCAGCHGSGDDMILTRHPLR